MPSPTDRKYTNEHEWVRLDGDTATIGITDYAQSELGDVVYVELPAPSTQVTRGETFGVVESVKAASDLYAPVSGEVVAANTALQDAPDLINKEPHEGGWMIKVRPSSAEADLNQLMDGAAYDEFLK